MKKIYLLPLLPIIIFILILIVQNDHSKKISTGRENSIKISKRIDEKSLTIKDFYMDNFDYLCITFPYQSGYQLINDPLLSNKNIDHQKILDNIETEYSIIIIKGSKITQTKLHNNFFINNNKFYLKIELLDNKEIKNCFESDKLEFFYSKKADTYRLFFMEKT